jgi:DNA helicase-2/ATP-dependent DNA helicase PcrA
MEDTSQNDSLKDLKIAEDLYVLEPSGPLLLLLGPGTGKTYDLARRVHWLLFKRTPSVSPGNILVVTYTTEATKNMRKRMSDKTKQKLNTYVPPHKQPKVATLHSLGHEIISQFGKEIGLPQGLAVLPSGPIRDILLSDSAQLKDSKREKGKEVGLCRTNGDCRKDTSTKCSICDTYVNVLRTLNIIDYDDQIFEACKVLHKSEIALKAYKAKAQHMLVDEYQDINQSQHNLISLLTASQEHGFFAVGDDDQSIYEFRGGSLKFIKEFENNYGKGTIRHKILSRRCSRHILSGSLDIVKKYNTGRLIGKPDMATTEDGDPILIHRFPTDVRETEFIARLTKDRSKIMDVLILVPNQLFASPLSSALVSIGIDHTSPFRSEKTEIGFLILLERWLEKTEDNFALRIIIERMIESGYLGIPSARTRKNKKLQARESGLKTISDYWKPLLEKKQSLFEVITEKAGSDPIASSINRSLADLKEARNKQVAEYFKALTHYFDIYHGANDSMIHELKRILSQAEASSGMANVRIMTMQSAKGLEADCVIIVGLDEGVIPRANPGTIDEACESRLLFVSMTRAKSELHLCHSANRSGAYTFLPSSFALQISRFVKAISDEHRKYICHK